MQSTSPARPHSGWRHSPWHRAAWNSVPAWAPRAERARFAHTQSAVPVSQGVSAHRKTLLRLGDTVRPSHREAANRMSGWKAQNTPGVMPVFPEAAPGERWVFLSTRRGFSPPTPLEPTPSPARAPRWPEHRDRERLLNVNKCVTHSLKKKKKKETYIILFTIVILTNLMNIFKK